MNEFNQDMHSQQGGIKSGERISHSGLGVSSFILACLGSVSMFALIAFATVIELNSPDGLDEESTQAITLGLGMMGSALGLLLSAGLGIASLFQSSKKRIFGILGLCISASVVAMFLLLLIVGLAMD